VCKTRVWQVVLAVRTGSWQGCPSRVWPDASTAPAGRKGAVIWATAWAAMLRGAAWGPVCVIGGDIPGVTSCTGGKSVSAARVAICGVRARTGRGYWLIA